jgi:regulatory protein
MAAAAALLASRPWTVADMRHRLGALGYRAALVEGTVARLVELGYLDDERYAAAWIASRDRSRPRGSTALRRELRRKGIEPAVIEAALADRDEAAGGQEEEQPAVSIPAEGSADLAAAVRLLERRAAALSRESDLRKRRHKAYALLARNGFTPDVAADAARRLTAADHGDDGMED